MDGTVAGRPLTLAEKIAVTGRRINRAIRPKPESNLVAHAKRELGAKLQDDGYDGHIAKAVLELIAKFAAQGHSGFSAGFTISTFKALANFEPLGPLTGADDEWVDHGDCMQNRRCGHVFKQPDRFDGQAYDSQARIFRDPDGSCCTNGDSAQPITFPYTPASVTVDRPAPA